MHSLEISGRFMAQRSGYFACLVLLFAIATGGAFAQSDESSRSAEFAPRTPWGDPDLQGLWSSGGAWGVPFERPEQLGARGVFTEEEHAAREAARVEAAEGNSSKVIGAPNLWLEVVRPPRQTSLVVEPENGRLPTLTDDGARRAEAWRTTSAPSYPYASVEDLRPYDRCITRGVLGSAFPNFYSSVTAIFQTPGFVIVRHEMIHETRVIPLDERAHISSGIQQWMGDSRGRWEGDTLVVETTNFNGRTGSFGRNGNGNPTTEALRLVERIRLLDLETLEYEVRVVDPGTFTRPWTVRFSLPRDDDYVMYEYACHAGNYALGNMLRGARAVERAASSVQ
jgi:hypothetical protein